jgi:dipeptidyl-peptidase-4
MLPPLMLNAQQTPALSVQDIFGSSRYASPSLPGVVWRDGGEKYSYEQYDTATHAFGSWIAAVSDGKREPAFVDSLLKLPGKKEPLSYSASLWSPDERSILFIGWPPKRQYLSRHTPEGNYFLYDCAAKTLRPLTDTQEPQYNVKFSPDGSRIGFVRRHNIYVLDLKTGKEKQLTQDGAEHVLNGTFDWVYEEEFGLLDGWQWSPDGTHIAYWQMDENGVPEFTMTDFMKPECDPISYRYPKPGDRNSAVRIGVLSLAECRTQWMDLGTKEDCYIPRMQWLPDGKTLAVVRLNRRQDTLEVLEADAGNGKTKNIFTETTDFWIEEGYDLHFLKTKNAFLWISDRDGYSHIYIVDRKSGTWRQITKGNWEVSDIVDVDEKTETIYFLGTKRTPLEKQFYSVRMDGSRLQQLTGDGFSHTPNLSPNKKYFLDTYSNVSTPPRFALMTTCGKKIRDVEGSGSGSFELPEAGRDTFFTVTTQDGGILNGRMLKPSDFNPSKKYPVLFDVYGGPGSQSVVNRWGGSMSLWDRMMTQKGYIVVDVDGRGTGQRGKAFRSIVYKHLGTIDVTDQIEAAHFAAKLPYVDSTRIGIWGWSYGGYMAVSTLLKGNEIFKTAVAVAPVTDWRLYDDIYTERYMGLPANNPEGYKVSSTLNFAHLLKGNLLLIHGTTDDNVHTQNTMQLIDALQKAGKHFHTMFYVDKNHSIYGGNTRVHLFETITQYLLDKL